MDQGAICTMKRTMIIKISPLVILVLALSSIFCVSSSFQIENDAGDEGTFPFIVSAGVGKTGGLS